MGTEESGAKADILRRLRPFGKPARAAVCRPLQWRRLLLFPHQSMPMTYRPVLATLAYILSADRQHVLLIHRNRRREDPHFGRYNGLGGKLASDEDIVAGIRREVREESALECTALSLRGTVSWPGFGSQGEDWFGFIFLVHGWRGEPLPDNPEGTLEWVARDRLLELPLWEGDRHFLPLVFDPAVRQFHGVMPYRDGRPTAWDFSVL